VKARDERIEGMKDYRRDKKNKKGIGLNELEERMKELIDSLVDYFVGNNCTMESKSRVHLE
jgi:hypothetical protein